MVTGWPNLSNPVDDVMLFIMAISLVLLLGVTGTMVYFAVRYSRARNPKPSQIEGNLALEIIWTVVPTLLVLAIFYAGWKGFQYMRTVPPDAMLVKVTARMWSWNFQYENGRQSGTLKVPLGKPVKLSLTSLDVLHSLYIPAFRVKEDCVPNRETYLWFRPDQPGMYDLFCTEYCGVGHSSMITKVEVLPEEQFQKWYRIEPPKPALARVKKKPDLRAEGERLVREKGCVACHSIDGTKKIGPTFQGVFGHRVVVVTNGAEREITADEEYLKRSIFEPQADLVKGYPPVMPSQKGVVTEKEADAIIEYLKSLK
jgi:cytochrome c oxidase subunit 2